MINKNETFRGRHHGHHGGEHADEHAMHHGEGHHGEGHHGGHHKHGFFAFIRKNFGDSGQLHSLMELDFLMEYV